MTHARLMLAAAICVALTLATGAELGADSRAERHGRVAERDRVAHRRRRDRDGGTAIDAAVATAFALAVMHPTAGNIGGGGFIVYRPATGEAVTYDFREKAPAKASPTMWMKDGKYSSRAAPQQPPRGRRARHRGRTAPGVEGAGQAAVEAARRPGDRAGARRLPGLRGAGAVAEERAAARCRSIRRRWPQFTKNGVPYEAGETLKQPDLARTLDRIATQGPAGLLRRRDGAAAREGDARARRPDHARGSQELHRRSGARR